jgi:hypothetical protein
MPIHNSEYSFIALTLKMSLGILLVPNAAPAQPSWLKEIIRKPMESRVAKDASLLVLLNWEKIEITRKFKAKSEIRKVYKILKPSGVPLSSISDYSSPLREIGDIEGWIIHSDGTNEELEEKNIIKTSTSGLLSFYHERQNIIAGFHNAKAGDIVAYRYEIVDKEIFSTYQRFVFQDEEPVMDARYEVEIPEGWQMQVSGWRTDSISYTHTGTVHSWAAKDLPFEPDEPFVPSQLCRTRFVSISAYDSLAGEKNFSSWEKVAAWGCSTMDPGVQCDTSIESLVRPFPRDSSTSFNRIRAIARYVAEEIRYVAVELGTGRLQPRPAPTTLANRYGDCKDKTALMRSMLRAAGIPSYAVLANTTVGIDSSLPNPSQFNHCIVGIPVSSLDVNLDSCSAIAGDILYYDPSDRFVPFGSLTNSLRNDYVLILRGGERTLSFIPPPSPQSNYESRSAHAILHPNGSFEAEITIRETGSQAEDTRLVNRTGTRQEIIEHLQSHFRKTVPQAIIMDLNSVECGDSTITTFRLMSPDLGLRRTGIRPLRLNIFDPPESSPFKPGVRRHPIWFGSPALSRTTVIWELPPSSAAQENVPAFSHSSDLGTIACNIQVEAKRIVYNLEISRTGVVLHPKEIAGAQEYYLRAIDARSLAILIGKQ